MSFLVAEIIDYDVVGELGLSITTRASTAISLSSNVDEIFFYFFAFGFIYSLDTKSKEIYTQKAIDILENIRAMSTSDTLPRRIKPLPQRRSRTVYTATIPIPGNLARDPQARLNITTSPGPQIDIQNHPFRDLLQSFSGFLAGLSGAAGGNLPPDLRETLNALSGMGSNASGEDLVGAAAVHLARHLSAAGNGTTGVNLDLRGTFNVPAPAPPPPLPLVPQPPTPQRERDREVDSESDEDTHLSQPGNTKKRKVPGLTTHSSLGHSLGPNSVNADSTPSAQRMSKITLAGMRHKDLLNSRKRQLTAVLGKEALEGEDDVDVERLVEVWGPFPLETNKVTPIAKGRWRVSSVPIRRSKRDIVGRSRSNKENADVNIKKKAGAPKGEFTFQFGSAASTRLRTATNQVLSLRPRFETEFAKQSSSKRDKEKAIVSPREKDKERGRKRNRAAPPSVPPTPEKSKALPPTTNTAASSPAPPPTVGGGGKKKKKKRSALANASNPHHLRNYVPSRLPHQPPSSNHTSQVQGEWAPPLTFLRAGKGENEGGGDAEWICAFCEYELFYGDEADLKRAVRKRKAILKRRKRARERARGVTSGTSNRTKPKPQQEEDVQDDGEGYDDGEEEYDEAFDEGGSKHESVDTRGGGGGGGPVRSVVKG
ncbi:trna guanine-n1-methyltransferase [Moniliophthora roreri MCA 2997]|uniref:Trna guanine-n1-methyltransferase n=2 Tax=Moniliophthora roreri TaxID=221103 RepID=V2X7R8_MONRO|nr:trna guanine-n1-methyltransferase [Moniliophthora roreri MCA 2997]